MRVASAINQLEMYVEVGPSLWDACFFCGNSTFLQPCVNSIDRQRFFDIVQDLKELFEDTAVISDADDPAIRAIVSIINRYQNHDKDVTYRDILESRVAWERIRHFVIQDDKSPRFTSSIRHFLEYYTTSIQEQYVGIVVSIAHSLERTVNGVDFTDLDELAKLHRLLDISLHAITVEQWKQILDALRGMVTIESKADQFLDPYLAKRISIYEKIMRNPSQKFEFPNDPLIDTRNACVGTPWLRQRHDALLCALFDVRYLTDFENPGLWHISDRAELNSLFNASTTNEFTEVAAELDGTLLSTELIIRIRARSCAEAAHLGLGPFEPIVNSLIEEDIFWGNPIVAKTTAHLCFAFIISGLHTLKISQSANMLQSILSKYKRVIGEYRECDLKYARRLEKSLNKEGLRQLPFGALLHIYEWTTCDCGDTKASSIQQWFASNELEYALRDRKTLLHNFMSETSDMLSESLSSHFFQNHVARYGLCLCSAEKWLNHELSEPELQRNFSARKLVPPFTDEESADPIVQQVLALKSSKDFKSDYEEYRRITITRSFFEDRIWDATSILMEKIGPNGIGAPSVVKRLQTEGWPAVMRYIVFARLALALLPDWRTTGQLAKLLGDFNPDNLDKRGGTGNLLSKLRISDDVRRNPRNSEILQEEDLRWIEAYSR